MGYVSWLLLQRISLANYNRHYAGGWKDKMRGGGGGSAKNNKGGYAGEGKEDIKMLGVLRKKIWGGGGVVAKQI